MRRSSLRGVIQAVAEACLPAGRAIAFGLLSMSFLLIPFLSGCRPQSAEARVAKPVVTVNKLQLTLAELEQEFRNQLPWAHPAEGVLEGEPEWLSRLIERELLVQEARRLGLDREFEFQRTIERFWKEALIKMLLLRKNREISGEVRVYEREIEDRYRTLEEASPAGTLESLNALRPELERAIRQEKEAAALERWIGELRSGAQIVIDGETLRSLQ